MMYYLKNRVGLIIYGILSMVEGLLNTLLYITHLDKIKVVDISMPFYFWWSDNILKTNYIRSLKTYENAD
jgi:hypothetical protein